jgi:hypothetical protein
MAAARPLALGAAVAGSGICAQICTLSAGVIGAWFRDQRASGFQRVPDYQFFYWKAPPMTQES